MKTIDFADGNFEILTKIERALEPLRKTEGILNSIPESVFRQAAYMDRISRIFTPAAITAQIEQYERMRQQLDAVMRLQSSPAFESAYRHLEAVNQSMVFDSAEALLKSSKMLEAYENAALVAQMENVLNNIPTLDQAVFELAEEFDIADVDFSDDGDIFCGGERYKAEDLAAEVAAQIDSAKNEKVSVREKAEDLKKRFWLLILIVKLLLFLPQTPEIVDYYSNAVSEIQAVIGQAERICYTIRDISYLREEADSSSRIIIHIPYDSTLEIIDDIPRWYRVKYAAVDGEEYLGWISKISVEK